MLRKQRLAQVSAGQLRHLCCETLTGWSSVSGLTPGHWHAQSAATDDFRACLMQAGMHSSPPAVQLQESDAPQQSRGCLSASVGAQLSTTTA